jgi:outer membrane protein assembly factor BamB
MSRTVPAVADGFVVTIGPRCHVLCADAVTGAFRWGLDLVAKYGTKVPGWYTGQCPLIEKGRAILAPAGSKMMIAVDCATGKVAWETPNPDKWRMTHSSIVPMMVDDTRMYVYCASGGVVGVAAETGHVLWKTTGWTVTMATTPSPVPVGEGRVFLCGGYGAGAVMLRVERAGETWTVKEDFRLPPGVFGSEQQTPILYRGYIYGIKENGEMVCLAPSGKVIWRSGRLNRFGEKGRGPYLAADGLLLALDSDGLLTLVDAVPQGFRALARHRVLRGHEAWGPMALAGGRLLARDLKRMVCVDLREEKE